MLSLQLKLQTIYDGRKTNKIKAQIQLLSKVDISRQS